MISFRFHIVSLTAIFLALAIGIAIGAGVVDRQTVDFLEQRLNDVRDNADRTSAENSRLQADVSQWERFGDQGAAAFVGGKLNAPVVLVGVQGVDRKPLDDLRQLLVAAGARLQGTVWFTSKLKLANPDDARELRTILGVASARPDTLRRALATRLAEGWVQGGAPTILPALIEAAFIDFEPPSGEPVDLALLVPAGTFTVVMSGARAEVPNAEVAAPFVSALVQRVPTTVLAAESGRAATPDRPAERAVFLRPLRGDAAVADKLSTVDNLEDLRGRVAVVLAVAALAEGKTGHYGIGPGAQRLVPEVGA
jgi:hypothetical protein